MPWEATKISNERDIEKQGFFKGDEFQKVKIRNAQKRSHILISKDLYPKIIEE